MGSITLVACNSIFTQMHGGAQNVLQALKVFPIGFVHVLAVAVTTLYTADQRKIPAGYFQRVGKLQAQPGVLVGPGALYQHHQLLQLFVDLYRRHLRKQTQRPFLDEASLP